jgi:acyl-CoA thioester hydrolase
MMAHAFTRTFRVRHYECDLLGHVNNAVYQHYLEQTAIEAAADAGYSMTWHAERGVAWVVRRITLEYLRPAGSGDVLDITTWVSSWGRTHSQREYAAVRRSDGLPIVNASADWVFVDRATGRPTRIPVDLADIFGGDTRCATRPYPLPEKGLDAGAFRWRHRVARYEVDFMQHVNNAAYLNWFEEAKFRAADEAGWTVERMREAGFMTVQVRHDTRYLLPATYGDELDVVSRLYELRRVRGTWLHAVYRAGTGELLAQNRSTGAFRDLEGRPTPAPPAMLEALLRGAG